jgi:hypothetical protein
MPDFHHLPVLIGTDGQSVPLFYVLEVLDESLNYENVLEQLPTLSYVQIVGALAFLRKVVQANSSGIDFDAVEDYQLSNDTDFIGVLREAIADKEIARVLHRG